jgi:MFS family permease
MAIFMGGTPIGAPIIGFVGSHFGARWTIGVGGILSLVTALVAVAWTMRSKRLTVRYRLRQSPHLLLTPSRAATEARAEQPDPAVAA